MSYYVFLDDMRFPKNVTWKHIPNYNWTIVRTYNQFVDIITKKGIPLYICYDHDLGFEHYGDQNVDYSKYKEKTGYDCAKWMVEHCSKHGFKHPDYVVHSMNPVGGKNIEFIIEKYNNDFEQY